MYIAKHFRVSDREEIFSFIQANAFGQLISVVNKQLFSTHIPFLLSDNQLQLTAHIARQNPQWEDINGQEVLVTLQGPHDYISPSWYSTPGVPTWNYQAVHVYGKCKVFHEPEKLKSVVDTLAAKYESAFEQPWQPTYQASMLGGIVGIEIEITELQCKYKLNQNRSLQDQSQVAEQLKLIGSSRLSQAMSKIANENDVNMTSKSQL